MILRRFFEPQIAQASYLIGCAATGEAIVIDPNRDIEQYIAAAEAEHTRITHVTETHIHADFVSGARELAARTGARLLLSDMGEPPWKYEFAASDGATLLKEGDRIDVGNVGINVVHTPGHTPEHLTFVVTDRASASEPIGAVTGDFLFVGDVGRPDLLERAAHFAGTMEVGARTLFASLQRFAARPDWLQIWPGHGAGSACGKGISAIPQSTLGYERRFNWAFQIASEADFVATVLAGQPDPPKYFAEMKRVNKAGPAIFGGVRRPPLLQTTTLDGLLREGAIVVDTRHPADFAAGHIPGTINIPWDASFTTWAGWLLPYEQDLHLVVNEGSPGVVEAVVRALAMIGLDRVAGYFDGQVIDLWAASERPLGTIPRIEVEDLAASLAHDAVTVLDVRSRREWGIGHIAGAHHAPLGELVDRLDELPRTRPVVVQCAAGSRSAIAASILLAHGFDRVVDLVGGTGAWTRAGLPVVAEG